MTPKGQNTKMTRMGSYYIAYERKFHEDFKNIKVIFFWCNMTPECRYWAFRPLNFQTSIFRDPWAPTSLFQHQRRLNFSANIFRVKLCNMTPKVQITKMTPIESYHMSYDKKFYDDFKHIKINILFCNMTLECRYRAFQLHI